MPSAFVILVVASLLNYLLPGSSYSRPTPEPKLRYYAKIQGYNHWPRTRRSCACGPSSSGDADKLFAKTRKPKTSNFQVLNFALTFSHTRNTKGTKSNVQATCHCAVGVSFLSFILLTCTVLEHQISEPKKIIPEFSVKKSAMQTLFEKHSTWQNKVSTCSHAGCKPLSQTSRPQSC